MFIYFAFRTRLSKSVNGLPLLKSETTSYIIMLFSASASMTGLDKSTPTPVLKESQGNSYQMRFSLWLARHTLAHRLSRSSLSWLWRAESKEWLWCHGCIRCPKDLSLLECFYFPAADSKTEFDWTGHKWCRLYHLDWSLLLSHNCRVPLLA